jgi:hypothetical protein
MGMRGVSRDDESGESNTPKREFSQRVADALAWVVSNYDPESAQSEEAARIAVLNAAAEAKAQLWRPDELMAALRAAVESREPESVREMLYASLKRRAMVAFFGV